MGRGSSQRRLVSTKSLVVPSQGRRRGEWPHRTDQQGELLTEGAGGGGAHNIRGTSDRSYQRLVAEQAAIGQIISSIIFSRVVCEWQGTHCTGKTGKTGKMAKEIPCQGKHREFGNFAKTQGIWFGQVVNSLILKIKYTSIFTAKISKNILKLDKSPKSVLCV